MNKATVKELMTGLIDKVEKVYFEGREVKSISTPFKRDIISDAVVCFLVVDGDQIAADENTLVDVVLKSQEEIERIDAQRRREQSVRRMEKAIEAVRAAYRLAMEESNGAGMGNTDLARARRGLAVAEIDLMVYRDKVSGAVGAWKEIRRRVESELEEARREADNE